MVLFSVLNIILLSVLMRDRSLFKPQIFIAYLTPLFLFAVWGFEYSSGGINFFISDEISYAAETFSGFPDLNDRFLWLLVNYWVANYDIYLHGLPLKLMNIPIFVGFFYLLDKIFPSNRNILLLFMLPYLPFSAVFNLRDMAIWFFSTLSIYLSSKSSWKSCSCFLPLIVLFLLRPFAAMLISGLIIIVKTPEILLFIKETANATTRMMRIIVVVVAWTCLLLMAYPQLHNKIETYSAWYEYTTTEGETKHIEGLPDPILTGNGKLDFAIASVRYFLTPMPHSLIKRISTGGSENWGLFDDLVRLVNQTGYYLILHYLLFNSKYLMGAMRALSKTQKMLLISMSMYWPIYSFHLYGVTHQRLKLPLQIALFFLAMAVHQKKQEFKPEILCRYFCLKKI